MRTLSVLFSHVMVLLSCWTLGKYTGVIIMIMAGNLAPSQPPIELGVSFSWFYITADINAIDHLRAIIDKVYDLCFKSKEN
jgi:hypothetical protein